MSPKSTRVMFVAAALFNWIVGAALFFIPSQFLQLFQISPQVEQLLWIQLFAGIVFVFGVGYYWASQNLKENLAIVRLGAIGKWTVVLIGLWNVFSGQVSWQFMLPASADAVFAILFSLALRDALNLTRQG